MGSARILVRPLRNVSMDHLEKEIEDILDMLEQRLQQCIKKLNKVKETEKESILMTRLPTFEVITTDLLVENKKDYTEI